MSLRKLITERAGQLMADPRLLKVVQSEQFMKTLMFAMSLPGKVDGLTRDASDRIARKLKLATEGEVTDLKRTVRSLEDQISELKRRGG